MLSAHLTCGALALLNEWADWMQAAGFSARTITDRVQLVRRFEASAGVPSTAADWQSIARFLGSEHFGPGTRQTYHAHLRAWFSWLVVLGHRSDDPMVTLRAPKTPRRRARPLSPRQLEQLLEIRMHRRTRIMILLAAAQGLRVSEIAAMRGDLIRGDRLRVVGKGGVDVDIPLHPIIEEDIAPSMPRGWWFPSHVNEGHILGNSVSTIISQAMGRAGVPGTPHALRHFFGTYTLRGSGGNLLVTQTLMRHAKITSTTVYTEVDEDVCRAAMCSLPIPRHLAA